MLVAPRPKHLGFTLGSKAGTWDLHDVRHAERPQLADLPHTRVLVGEPPADEFVVFSTWRIGENRNPRSNAVLHEVRRFERPGAPGMKRYDDDVGARDRIVDDEGPSRGSEKRIPNRRNSRDGSRMRPQ